MSMMDEMVARRAVLRTIVFALGAGAAVMLPAGVVHAAGLLGDTGIGSGGLGNILGHASDKALDKLSVPGAFYGDSAVRIALPLMGGGGAGGGLLGDIMAQGSKLGLTDGLSHKLNDAAGLAARQAKPVFHSAISKLTLTDVPGIAARDDGATQYLRKSSSGELTAKLRPLIDSALAQVGAFKMLESLTRDQPIAGMAGISPEKLGASVTSQALGGIFKYIASEEHDFRANPLGPAGSMMPGLFSPH